MMAAPARTVGVGNCCQNRNPNSVAQMSAVYSKGARKDIGYFEVNSSSDVAKVSVIGVGMRSHAGVAKKMFQVLADKGINIQVISTSEIKVSVLIAEEYTELALRALHTAYGLDAA